MNTYELFAEFKVTSEKELFDFLIKESYTLPCSRCKEEIPIDDVYFVNGDPYCKHHALLRKSNDRA